MFGEMPTTRCRLPVLKIRGGMRCDAVCRSSQVFGMQVHWLGNRSFVCPGSECPACVEYLGARWLGMLAVVPSLPEGQSVGTHLVELSAGSFDRMTGLQRMADCKSLLGLTLEISRRHDRSGLRVEPDFDGVPSDVVELPFSVLGDAVAVLYALPAVIAGEQCAEWSQRVQPAARRLLDIAVPSILTRKSGSRRE